MQAPTPAHSPGELLDLPDPSATLHWNVQVVDFFSQRIPVQAEQLSRLNLITLGFLQSLRNEWSFNRRNQHRMKIASRSIPHAFDEIPHFPFHVVFETQRRRCTSGGLRARNGLHKFGRASQDGFRSGNEEGSRGIDVMR